MISMNEILKGKKLEEQDLEVQENLKKLLEVLNKIRSAYGKSLVVTSGLRTKADQIRVYTEKGITDIAKIPMASRHLYGQAVDFSDPKGELKEWVMKNLSLFEELGLYMEDFQYTKTWVHLQIVAPKSGKRFFKP